MAEVGEVAKSASSVIAAEYRGLNVAEMTELRRQARTAGVYLRVVPNRLAKRAVESTEFECLREDLSGPARARVRTGGPGLGGEGRPRLPAGQPEARGPAGGVRREARRPGEIDHLANLPTYEEASPA